MWTFNPADPSSQPIRPELLANYPEVGDVRMLPPAWRVDVVPGPSDYPVYAPGLLMQSSVESLTPLRQIQRIRWSLDRPEFSDPTLNNVPSGGTFRLSLGQALSETLSYNATNADVEAYLRHAASAAGLPAISARVERDERASLLIRMQAIGEPGYAFPVLQLQSQVTGGGLLIPEASGGFILPRRMDYYRDDPPFVPPYEQFPESQWPALQELIDAEFLWQEWELIWFRAERTAGLVMTDTEQWHNSYWQLGYQLQINHDPMTGVLKYSPGWAITLQVERQHIGGDFISGVHWPLQEPEKFIANQPATFGRKEYLLSPNEQLGFPGDTATYYSELPEFVVATPVWF